MAHEKFMERALVIALEKVRANQGGPFGALVVRGNEIASEAVAVLTAYMRMS